MDEDMDSDSPSLAVAYNVKKSSKKKSGMPKEKMAIGGMPKSPEPCSACGHYAEGGTVDLEANSEESPNNEDQMSFEANGKEQYDLDQLSDQPEDSNEKGDGPEHESENAYDMIGDIRKKMRARRGF